jgi:hypothetical protein
MASCSAIRRRWPQLPAPSPAPGRRYRASGPASRVRVTALFQHGGKAEGHGGPQEFNAPCSRGDPRKHRICQPGCVYRNSTTARRAYRPRACADPPRSRTGRLVQSVPRQSAHSTTPVALGALRSSSVIKSERPQRPRRWLNPPEALPLPRPKPRLPRPRPGNQPNPQPGRSLNQAKASICRVGCLRAGKP